MMIHLCNYFDIEGLKRYLRFLLTDSELLQKRIDRDQYINLTMNILFIV